MKIRSLLACAVGIIVLTGCAKAPFEARVAPGFVEVKEDDPAYDFRAVAPEGVAVAVRVESIEDKSTDVGFWERAVALRMRELEGYALVTTRGVKSGDGTAGRELVFGHDQDGKPFVYRIRLFVSGAKLLIVEAGGAKDQMERFATNVEWMMSEVRFR